MNLEAKFYITRKQLLIIRANYSSCQRNSRQLCISTKTNYQFNPIAFTPYVGNANAATNWMSPRSVAELYANIVNSFCQQCDTATRLTNNMIFGNMEAFKTSIQQVKDNTKELSRIGVNTAKTFEQISNENTRRDSSTNIV